MIRKNPKYDISTTETFESDVKCTVFSAFQVSEFRRISNELFLGWSSDVTAEIFILIDHIKAGLHYGCKKCMENKQWSETVGSDKKYLVFCCMHCQKITPFVYELCISLIKNVLHMLLLPLEIDILQFSI
ncbi:unnamed protein product [Acanthoscelides obtectus]|uniref:Uncharacterized protein n=1 Tax=Acanthoscelides obtectus TaxID=200917 RepID=A0A9P0JPC7_ACAOB|nr:unnamed protein product [Acanthoscelides obtectus]CAK1655066.1 hypothetical protein AOBTE_LOCUS19002 [Acanthoscelides obtectus]